MFIPYPDAETVPEQARQSFAEQVRYISPSVIGCHFSDAGAQLQLSASAESQPELHSRARALLQQVVESFARVEDKTIFANEGSPTYGQDPLPSLLESGQVRPVQPGVFCYEGDFLRVLRGVDGVFRRFACDNGYREVSTPPTLPSAALLANGYLTGFPQHALFVGPVRHSMESVDFVARQMRDPTDPSSPLAGHLGPHGTALSPSACFPLFESLRGQSVADHGLRLTTLGACHRHEGGNTDGLVRLHSYRVRELLLLGPAPVVEQGRSDALEHAEQVLSRWGVRCRVNTASDAFFSTGAESKRYFQAVMELKYELQLYLPFADAWLAASSFNDHQGTLTRLYGIGAAGSQDLVSACVGHGRERFAYALCAQHGPDPEQWPAPLKADLFEVKP